MSRTIRIAAFSVGVLASAALLPTTAFADKTCNGFIDISYQPPQAVSNIGDVRDIHIDFGTGSIQNGTKLIIHSFQFNLDCNANDPLTPPCTDEGPLVEYEGDAAITTTCAGTTWTTNVPGGGSAVNQIIFTASPQLEIPPNVSTPPGLCSVDFKVKVLGVSTDKTPNEIEELVGYDIGNCDNGVLLSGGFQTSSITTPSPLHFSCYEVPRGNMPDVTGLSLIDRFGSTTASAIEVKRICAPTDKNGEDPTAVAAPTHLTAFTVVTTGGSFSKPKNVHVANQFGNLEFDVVAPVLLFEPSSKSLTPPPPPPLAATDVPNFQCYKLTNVTGDKDIEEHQRQGSVHRSVRRHHARHRQARTVPALRPGEQERRGSDRTDQPDRAPLLQDAGRQAALPAEDGVRHQPVRVVPGDLHAVRRALRAFDRSCRDAACPAECALLFAGHASRIESGGRPGRRSSSFRTRRASAAASPTRRELDRRRAAIVLEHEVDHRRPSTRPRYPLLNAGDPGPPSIRVRNESRSPSSRPSRMPRGTPRNDAVPATASRSARSRNRSVEAAPSCTRPELPSRRRSAACRLPASETRELPRAGRSRRARHRPAAARGDSYPAAPAREPVARRLVVPRRTARAAAPSGACSNGWSAKSTYCRPASWNSTRFTADASGDASHASYRIGTIGRSYFSASDSSFGTYSDVTEAGESTTEHRAARRERLARSPIPTRLRPGCLPDRPTRSPRAPRGPSRGGRRRPGRAARS